MPHSSQRNIKLLLEYDGAPYAGWQQQANADSVQARLVESIGKVLGHAASLRVAGRTDAGVHAVGQVANFFTPSELPIRRIPLAINACLPDSVVVHGAEEMPASFDAKRDSKAKRYVYRLFVGRTAAPLLRARAWHLRSPHIDVEAMRRASTHLVGHLDFNAFRSVHCDAPHARRRMFDIDVTTAPRRPCGEIVEITLHANAFCRHMCRILAGTLVEVGLGKRSADDIADILSSRDRREAGVTAPPQGLTLLEVFY